MDGIALECHPPPSSCQLAAPSLWCAHCLSSRIPPSLLPFLLLFSLLSSSHHALWLDIGLDINDHQKNNLPNGREHLELPLGLGRNPLSHREGLEEVWILPKDGVPKKMDGSQRVKASLTTAKPDTPLAEETHSLIP